MEPKSRRPLAQGVLSLEVEEERMLIHCRPIFVKVMQLDYHLPRQNKIQLRLMQPVLLRDGNSSFALMAKKGKDWNLTGAIKSKDLKKELGTFSIKRDL